MKSMLTEEQVISNVFRDCNVKLPQKYVYSNNSGEKKDILKEAISDARAIKNIMIDDAKDTIIKNLVNCSPTFQNRIEDIVDKSITSPYLKSKGIDRSKDKFLNKIISEYNNEEIDKMKDLANEYPLDQKDIEEILDELEQEQGYDKTQGEIDDDNYEMRHMDNFVEIDLENDAGETYQIKALDDPIDDEEIELDLDDGETYDLESESESNDEEDLLSDTDLETIQDDVKRRYEAAGFTYNGDEEEDDDYDPDDPDNVLNTEVDEDWADLENEKAKALQAKADKDPEYLAKKVAEQSLKNVFVADQLDDDDLDNDDTLPPVGTKHNEISPMESRDRAEEAAKTYRESIAYRSPFSTMQNVVSGRGSDIKLSDEERDRLMVFANLKENDAVKVKHLIKEDDRDFDAYKNKKAAGLYKFDDTNRARQLLAEWRIEKISDKQRLLLNNDADAREVLND